MEQATRMMIPMGRNISPQRRAGSRRKVILIPRAVITMREILGMVQKMAKQRTTPPLRVVKPVKPVPAKVLLQTRGKRGVPG